MTATGLSDTGPGGWPRRELAPGVGWHWQPYKYAREATDVNGERVLPFPRVDGAPGPPGSRRGCRRSAYGDGYTPDAALVNYYDRDACLGMHQDKDEHSPAPVVFLSIGDSCTFRFGNSRDRGQPYEDVRDRPGRLRSPRGPYQYHHARHRPGLTQSSAIEGSSLAS